MHRKFFSGLFLGILLSWSLAICSASPVDKEDYSYGKDDVVALYGPVNNENAAKVISRLQEIQDKSDRPIYLFIDSPGGDVFAGTKIIDAMTGSKRPVYTIDVGSAASMAAYIHSYGVKRFMLPHAFLMFHNASGTYEGDLEKTKSRIIFVSSLMTSLALNVSKRSGVPLDELQTRMNTEWYILSGEAKERNLVDGVVSTLAFPVAVPKKDDDD